MNLLPIGDGSTYIDLSEADEFDLPAAKYYRSKDGVWIRKEDDDPVSQVISEREVFKAFMNAGRFADAKDNFLKLFEDGGKVTVITGQAKTPTGLKAWPLLRFATGGIILLLLGAYIGLVVSGTISASRQISIGNLIVIIVGLIIIAILIRPQVLSNIQELGVGNLSIKMRLQEIQDTQKDHSRNLEEIHFILETLVTTSEMSHLRKLVYGRTANYKRNPSLDTELRRLRDVGLIKLKGKGRVGHLPATFDLAEYVELTARGADYIRRVKEMEAPSGPSTQPNGASR